MVPLLAALAARAAASIGFLAGVATGDNLAVGALLAPPGSTVTGYVRLAVGIGSLIPVPFALVNGNCPGQKVVITAGLHGGEFLGIMAAAKLARELDPSQICGKVVISPVANPGSAFFRRERYSAYDKLDINNEFPGRRLGSPTQRLARWLFGNVITSADAYVDLQSAGVDVVALDSVNYHVTSDGQLNARTRAMANSVGHGIVIRGGNQDHIGSSHVAAVAAGIPAIAIQFGDRGTSESELAEKLYGHVVRLLGHLGLFADVAVPPQVWVPDWELAGCVEAGIAGVWEPAPGIAPGRQVAEGDLIGHIRDVVTEYFEEVFAAASGRIISCLYAVTVASGNQIAIIAVQTQNAPALETAQNEN